MTKILKQFIKSPKVLWHLVAASFFIALLSLATSLFTIQVFNRFLAHGINGTLITLVIGTLLALVFEMAFRSLRRKLIVIHNSKHHIAYSIKAFQVLLQAQVSLLDQFSIGQRNEILRGIDTLRSAVMPQNIAALLDVPFSLLFIMVLALLSPFLALITLAAILILIFLAWRAHLSAQSETKRLQAIVAKRSVVLGSAISAAETIRVYNGSSFMLNHWAEVDKQASSLRISMANAKDLLQSRFGLISNIQTVAIISVGALQVISGDLSMGAMIGANILASRALMPITRVVQMAGTFVAAEQAADLLQEFVRLPLERIEGTTLQQYQGKITFKDLAFVFPGVSVLLFESLNLAIESGHSVLIVGPNGSGKTTLVRLLLGLIEPSRGQILVDGVDLKQVALPWWRQQICYLPQEPLLVTGSLKENIVLANPVLEESKLNEVIKLAELHSFLADSQDGLNLQITEGGRHLALGIRRRIALARALATEGQLFIADEPTEGMDAAGRRAVYQVFQKLKTDGKTIIVISHDDTFLRIADFRIDLGAKPIPVIQARKHDDSAEGEPRLAETSEDS